MIISIWVILVYQIKRNMNKLDVLESNLGIDKKFHCIKKEDIPSMAKYALKEANPLYPVPVIWNKKKMIDMYYKIQGD